MALDPGFALATLSPLAGRAVSIREIPALADTIERNSGRSWALRVRPDHCQLLTGERLYGPVGALSRLCSLFRDRWLVLDRSPLHDFDLAVDSMQRFGGNAYVELLRAGAVVLAPSEDCRLSGGSYADVRLTYADGRLGVRKVISQPEQRFQADAGSRLAREAAWLRSVPEPASSFFPRLLDVIETDSAVGYVSEFIPGYTLGEQLLDSRLPFRLGREALTRVWEVLVTHLYATTRHPIPHGAGRREYAVEADYLRRIRRRLRTINIAPSGTGESLKRLLYADTIVVNGVRCLGLPVILRALEGGRLGQHLRVTRLERAHGDLILDDIILSGDADVRFVDPNGSAGSRLYDIGKLCLSLTTCYEFFKYDLFDCHVESDRRPPSITVSLPSHPARSMYAELADRLPAVMADCGVLADDGHHMTGTGLFILNGLQNLGLPSFHLLRHAAERRAAAFLGLGLLRVTEGLRLMNDGHDSSLEDACRCIF